MSAHPFRRAGRNLAAAPLVWLGTALTNCGVRVMWPDDRRQSPADTAIVRVGAALEHAVQRYTDAVVRGTRGKHEARQLNKLIRQFLDLRAVLVGETDYLAAREQEQRERDRRHGELLGEMFGPKRAAEMEVEGAQERLHWADQ